MRVKKAHTHIYFVSEHVGHFKYSYIVSMRFFFLNLFDPMLAVPASVVKAAVIVAAGRGIVGAVLFDRR